MRTPFQQSMSLTGQQIFPDFLIKRFKMDNHIKVPTYLREFASNVSIEKDITRFSLNCPCGGTYFEVFRNKKDTEEEKSPFLSLGYCLTCDKNGRYYRRFYTFFGIPVGKKQYCDEKEADPDVVKIKCPHCGKEITVFHNLKHGYDGIVHSLYESKSILRYKPDEALEFNRIRKNCSVIIEVRQDLPQAELEDEFGENMSLDLYADTFGEISIKSVSEDGKSKTIASFETR